jgi:hypothetical protein
MRLLSIVIVLGCAKTQAGEPQRDQPANPPPTAAGTPMAARDAAVPVATCGADQEKLISEARGWAVMMFTAKDGASPYSASLEAWKAVAPGCRDGRWYYAAALLLTYRSTPIAAGATEFKTVDEVLTAALSASNTDDDELLARVAYNAAMGRKPAAPADACSRAKKVARPNADDAAYVCAREALANGDGKTAGELIAAMHQGFRFLDADLVAARAAVLRGDRAAAKKFAAAAAKVGDAAADRADVARDDAKLVVAAAKTLSK